MVKTWRYSSLKEFEQTMFSISEISPPFNLHRNNLVEMSTVSTYNILSFCINCHFVFWFFWFFFQCRLSKAVFADEQTMFSISEISRIYSLCSLKKHYMCHISYLHNTEIYLFHTFHCYFSCFTTNIEDHTIFYFSSSYVLTIEVLYLYDLTKLLCLLNLKNI
jgi:hypothetical protein